MMHTLSNTAGDILVGFGGSILVWLAIKYDWGDIDSEDNTSSIFIRWPNILGRQIEKVERLVLGTERSDKRDEDANANANTNCIIPSRVGLSLMLDAVNKCVSFYGLAVFMGKGGFKSGNNPDDEILPWYGIL